MSLKNLIEDIENLEGELNEFIDQYADCVKIKDTKTDVTDYYPKEFLMEPEDKYITVIKSNTYGFEKRAMYSDDNMNKFNVFRKNQNYEKSNKTFFKDPKEPIMYDLIEKTLDVSQMDNKVKCVYSNEEKNVSKIIGNRDKIKKLAETFNEEHIIPSGIYSKVIPIVCDLHNVFPCKQEINKARSNYVFADNIIPNGIDVKNNDDVKILKRKDYFDCEKLINTKQKELDKIPKENKTKRIPLANKLRRLRKSLKDKEYKLKEGYIIPYKNRGMIARSILYFHLVYWRNNKIEQIFKDSRLDKMDGVPVYTKYQEQYRSFMGDKWEVLKLAIKWHLKYAPDKYEINRNNKIFKEQGNKNPFICESFTVRLIKLKLITKCNEDEDN